LANCIDRGLAVVAPDLPAIRSNVEIVRSIAGTLDPLNGNCASRESQFTALRDQLQTSHEPIHQQMAKVLQSFQPGLFAGGDLANLPQDNLDQERWFRNPKGHERRIHGHRHAGVRIVLEGATLVHALDVHLRHPDPLSVAELLPYRDATAPDSQCQAFARRRIMRRARSTQQRPALLAELEERYRDSF
jgi:hypothetical protein